MSLRLSLLPWLAYPSEKKHALTNHIPVIRVFTRLRLNGATAWQAAVFPRKVFGKRDRRATNPRSDRA
jgi:hypothetical protein